MLDLYVSVAHAPATRERRAQVYARHPTGRPVGPGSGWDREPASAACSARACAPQKPLPLALQPEKGGAEYAQKNKWNKWKNHFFKMKGDVGMA